MSQSWPASPSTTDGSFVCRDVTAIGRTGFFRQSLMLLQPGLRRSRQTFIWLEMYDGPLLFLCLPQVLIEQPDFLSSLCTALQALDGWSCSTAEASGRVTDHLGHSVAVLDSDPLSLDAWGLSAWRGEAALAVLASVPDANGARQLLASSQQRCVSELRAAIDAFFAALDHFKLPATTSLSDCWIRTYNYLNGVSPSTRLYRRQAASLYPIFVNEILDRPRDNGWRKHLQLAIDLGRPFTDTAAAACAVRPFVVRHLQRLTFTTCGSEWQGRLELLLEVLNAIEPDLLPRGPDQWAAMNRCIKTIDDLTHLPIRSSISKALLALAAHRNYLGINTLQDEALIRGLSEIQDLLKTFELSLEHTALEDGRPLKLVEKTLANQAAVRLGISRLSRLGHKWVRFRDESNITSEDDKEYPKLILEHMLIGDTTIRQLVCKDQLEIEANAMHHCVASYHTRCSDGISFIFSLRDGLRGARSTLELMLNMDRLGIFKVEIAQLYGVHDTPAPAGHRTVAMALTTELLRTERRAVLNRAFIRSRSRDQDAQRFVRNQLSVSSFRRFVADSGVAELNASVVLNNLQPAPPLNG